MQVTQEIQVGSAGEENPLEEPMATHSSGESSDRGAWQATVQRGSKESDLIEQTHTHHTQANIRQASF